MFEVIYNLLTNPAFAAVLAASFTGVGVKLVSAYFENKNKDKILKVDEGTALRIDLRAEIASLRKELADQEISTETWREKYYSIMDKYNDAMNQLRIAKADLAEALGEIEKLKPPSKNA